ncbi:MAG: EamA family transporter [Acidobacteriota bacterium]|nr:EamA family transporter [Acidobacteriota bacterium]MDH3530978.1 EamA family transporter [Acidobacteriota bacterium]
MKFLVWFALCLIWGTTWLFIKVGLEEIPPFSFAMIRFLFSILVVGILLYSVRIPFPKGKTEWQLLAVTGFFQFSINYSLVFWSELHITSGLAAVLQAMIPVFGLLLAAMYLPEEKITWLKVGALVIGISGVAVIFYDQLRIESTMAFAGSAAIVIGAFAAAHASILTKAKGSAMHPATLLFGQMVCGTVPIIAIALIAEGNPLDIEITALGVLSVFYLAILGTVVSFWLYYWLLRRVESSKAMTIALVTPLIAVICGNLILGERLRFETLGGGLLILTSVGLIVFRRKLIPASNIDTEVGENV